MNLKTRLSKLEKTKRQKITEADCICFPDDQPPLLKLRAEREAAQAVLCPIHGERFSGFAGPLVWGGEIRAEGRNRDSSVSPAT